MSIVTGVQTCALPIWNGMPGGAAGGSFVGLFLFEIRPEGGRCGAWLHLHGSGHPAGYLHPDAGGFRVTNKKGSAPRGTHCLLLLYRLFRLHLQLLLTVDAAVFAVGAHLKDLVAFLFNGGDAAGIAAPHNVHQTLGGLRLFLAHSLAVFDHGHADVRVKVGRSEEHTSELQSR